MKNPPLNSILLLPRALAGDPLLEEVVQRGPEAHKIIARHGEAAGRADLVDVDEHDGPRAGDDGDLLRRDDLVKCWGSVFEGRTCHRRRRDSALSWWRIRLPLLSSLSPVHGMGDRTFPKDPQDPRRTRKGIEHHRNPPVARLVQMACRLDARAREIHVPELADHDRFVVVFIVAGFVTTISLDMTRFGLLDDTEERPALVGDTLGRDIDVPIAGQRGGTDPEDFLLKKPGDKRWRKGLVENAHRSFQGSDGLCCCGCRNSSFNSP